MTSNLGIQPLSLQYLDVCRLCLESDEEQLCDIFEPIEQEQAAACRNNKLHTAFALLDLEILDDDDLPKKVCLVCKAFMFQMQYFKEKAHKSLAQLWNAKGMEMYNGERGDTVTEKIAREDDEAILFCENTLESGDGVSLKGSDGSFEYIRDAKVPVNFTTADHTDEVVEEHLEVDEMCAETVTSQIQIDIDVDDIHSLTLPSGLIRPGFEFGNGKYCPICGIESTAMTVHIRTHTKYKPYRCNECEMCFYTSSKLKLHRQSRHSGERNYHCKLCQKTFALSKTLKAHLLSHSLERMHHCPTCDKRFTFQWGLTKHMRTHTGEKPFSCKLDGCSKSFATSSNLRQHQRTHSHLTEKLNVCDQCGKKFHNKYTFRSHYKSSHPDTPELYND